MDSNRNSFIDIMKGIGCIAVILLHAGLSTETTNLLLFPFWCTFAVPVFMFLTGYVNALSITGKGTGLKEYYRFRNILAKLVRFWLPFTIAFIVEVCYYFTFGQQAILGDGILGGLKIYLQGGIGPGSYYMPIMVQIILLMPIIVMTVNRLGYKGLLACGAFNLAFEVFQTMIKMNPEAYRLLCFRYVFIIAVGVYAALNKELKNKWILPLSFVLGIAFILENSYLGYKPVIFTKWSTTSMAACLFIIPILIWLIRAKENARFYPLEMLGKASFNIFLTQMVWYAIGYWFVQTHFSYPPLMILISMGLCLLGGTIFYRIENKFTSIIVKIIKG